MLRKKVQYSHIYTEMTPLCVERDKLMKIEKTLTWTFVVEFYSPEHRANLRGCHRQTRKHWQAPWITDFSSAQVHFIK